MGQRKHKVFEDGILISETPWSLKEELTLDSRLFYWRMMKAALDVDNQGWPHDIDEWRARYSTARGVEAYLTLKGYDPATIPVQVKAGLAAGVDFGLQAALFFYASDWQGIFDGASVNEGA